MKVVHNLPVQIRTEFYVAALRRFPSIWFAYIIAALAAVSTWLLHRRYPFGGANGDDFEYLELSRAWADGRWHDAINGYWSLLLPLLLSPTQIFGLSHTSAYAVIGMAVTATVVILVFLIGRELGGYMPAVVIVTLAAGIRAAIMSTNIWTPDLLLAAIGLGATLIALRMRWASAGSRWYLFGLVCGTLYLAKPMGLFTGVLMIGLVWILVCGPHIRDRAGSAILKLLLSIVGQLTIVIPVIGLLSWKYGYLTYGSSGSYNMNLAANGGRAYPVLLDLWDPPFPGSILAETDPTFMNYHLPYSIVSMDGLRLLWSNSVGNLSAMLQGHAPALVSLIFCLTAILVILDRSGRIPTSLTIALGFVLIHIAAYVPILFVNRHLIFPILLLSITLTGVVSMLFFHRSRVPGISLAISVLAIATLLSGSANIARGESLLGRADGMSSKRAHYELMTSELDVSSESCSRVGLRTPQYAQYWFESRFLTMDHSWFISGYLQLAWNYERTIAELVDHQIDCLVVWDDAELAEGLDAHLTPIADAEAGEVSLVIYRFDP